MAAIEEQISASVTSHHKGGRQVVSSFSFHRFIDVFDEASVLGCICMLMRSVAGIPVMTIVHISVCGKRDDLLWWNERR